MKWFTAARLFMENSTMPERKLNDFAKGFRHGWTSGKLNLNPSPKYRWRKAAYWYGYYIGRNEYHHYH